jgi:DNA adenine methylase
MAKKEGKNESDVSAMPKPFLKWAGGKGQLIGELKSNLPSSFGTYFEPFVGGGALLFSLQPSKAVINDCNADVINVYKVIKDKPEKLIEALKTLKNRQKDFSLIRDVDTIEIFLKDLSPVTRAARTVYLNKTCFNGLFRVNSQGHFNVPFARSKTPLICDEENIRAVSRFLKSNDISILNGDFASAVSRAQKGDFVYFDPPYDPVSLTASFTDYNKEGFGREEQQRLKEVCDDLDKRGVFFLLSNSSTDFVRSLYEPYRIVTVKAKRNINSNGQKRGEVEEVLVRNY